MHNEPSSDCRKIRPFRDFCIDLGRFSALLYTEAETAKNNVKANAILDRLANFEKSTQIEELPFLESIMLQLSKTKGLRGDNNNLFLAGLRGIISSGNNYEKFFKDIKIEDIINVAIKYVTSKTYEVTHKKDLSRSQKIASVMLFLKHTVDCEILNINPTLTSYFA